MVSLVKNWHPEKFGCALKYKKKIRLILLNNIESSLFFSFFSWKTPLRGKSTLTRCVNYKMLMVTNGKAKTVNQYVYKKMKKIIRQEILLTKVFKMKRSLTMCNKFHLFYVFDDCICLLLFISSRLFFFLNFLCNITKVNINYKCLIKIMIRNQRKYSTMLTIFSET